MTPIVPPLQNRLVEDSRIYDKQQYPEDYGSIESPMLNTGSLTPQQILEKTLLAATKYNVPLNSSGGFIRQVVGWREFMRMVYLREGRA